MIFDKTIFKRISRLKFYILVVLLLGSKNFSAEAMQSNISVQKFVSCIDGQEDCYALLPGKNSTLIVYLHSLSGDYKEPFKVTGEQNLAYALLKEFPGASFVSLDYGANPSWGNAAARLDISNNLLSIVRSLNIKRIVFVGVSMGAATALTYAATAPSFIKDKIIGIIAVSPSANLEDLYKQTGDPDVKSSLENVFGTPKDMMLIAYQQNSFDSCVTFLPVKVRVAIISATDDKQVPIEVQKDVARDLNNRDISVKTFEVEGKFDSLPIKSVIEASHFIIPQNPQ